MRISLNWLKRYVDIKIPDDKLIKLIGARLVEVEGVIDETHKYDKIYVVRVVKAERIPDTHLTLCQIDNGGDELVQVVCGAPNVREGMLAAWLAPGAVVPISVNEDAPFVIGTRKMLGKYDSCGMLAGADELDFDDKHEKIVEIDPNMARPGDLLADVFGLSDLILEIENKSLTHRPDCFGIIGFAREVAGILGERFVEEEALPRALFPNETASLKVSIDTNICSRYTAVVMDKHGEVKKKYLTWIDTMLSKSGMRPVDEIVDATNYLMLLTGQPLHAFDFDKFVAIGGKANPEVVVRLAQVGEKLTLLDGKEVELNENDIVVCSGERPVALAGAMGGAATAIDENTRKVILESATFSLYNLRKTQMAHGIFSEAITRFTKGQPSYQTLQVAERCAGMLADGFRVVEINDAYPKPTENPQIRIKIVEINGLLGTQYSSEVIKQTLMNVGFIISCDCGKKTKCKCEEIIVKAPEWRTDIHIKEDIVEEVGRLLGYDNIVPTLPKHATATQNKMLQLKTHLRDILKGFGANEVLTYSFVSERLFKKAGLDCSNAYKIVNSISPDLQYVRQSIIPSLLDKAYMNQKIPFDKFALFEMNKIYQKAWGLDEEDVPVEHSHIGLVLAERKSVGTPYYKAKFFVEKLLGEFNIVARYQAIKNEIAETLPFETKRAAEIWVNDRMIGVVGEFKNSVRRNYKLADYLAGFELDLDALLELAGVKKIGESFEVRDKQDITIESNRSYAEVLEELQGKYPDARITPVSIYQPDNSDIKNVTFHLEFR